MCSEEKQIQVTYDKTRKEALLRLWLKVCAGCYKKLLFNGGWIVFNIQKNELKDCALDRIAIDA